MPVLREIELEPIEAWKFLERGPGGCKEELECLRTQARDLGQVAIRDPRVQPADYRVVNAMMEAYFGQDMDALLPDIRVEHQRQVGLTEPYLENDPRHDEVGAALAEDCRPFPHEGPNPFMRFFWRYGDRPEHTEFPERHAEAVIPDRFQNIWQPVMDSWGAKVHPTALLLARMLEAAYELPEGEIVNLLHEGPHLIAPTGCDLLGLLATKAETGGANLAQMLIEADTEEKLERLGRELGLIGLVLSNFHTDFNLMTGHGPSNIPGLITWTTRGGEPFALKLPHRSLLFQFGEGMEYLFAGKLNPEGIMAGYHQVVVTLQTLIVLRARLIAGLPPIRVSSTAFFHANNDKDLAPFERYRAPGWEDLYPPTTFGTFGAKVIETICLGAEIVE